jgi:asparagine synthase (glutamine-hydrolysing)
MCGIFGYKGEKYSKEKLVKFLMENQHRGPDNTQYKEVNNYFFGFNRLKVNGLDEISNQPFNLKECYLICNGEIYNYKNLVEKYGLENEYYSNSDCEIIIHLYRKLGIEGLLQELDGVYSFILYDQVSDIVYVARDPLGIRSLYYCFDFDNDQYAVASEMKSLVEIGKVNQFPSGHYCSSEDWGSFKEFYKFEYVINENISESQVLLKLRTLLEKGVEKRLLSDRKIACLLSGGLDSTLVTAIVCRKLGAENVNTYSIGLEGSVDLKYAQIAADYFGTNHINIVVSEEEFLGGLEKTIKMTESWDTTTVRASTGNHLISLYINEHSEDKVIFCGDVSDEIFASYRGFMSADTSENFLKENVNMLKNIRYYDVLRSDKSISGAGLEARVPFGDLEFVNFVMSLPAKYKMFNKDKMEKYYLRKAFEGYLPDELLWRRKEAFSDGVSSLEKSWFEIIREYIDGLIPDEEFEERCKRYTYNTPYDKESLYYREVFEKYYDGNADTVPYFWRHPFSTILDPSARLLDTY